MIKRLLLNRFGKFTEKAFELKPVTVFYGDNEAGKSTVWDALFYKLCSPSGTTLQGKRLKGRYGDNLQVEVETNKDALTRLDADEFLNVYAIHSGDISIEWDEKKDWLKSVKARLFTGGIDPAKLADNFNNMRSDDKKMAHNRRLSELKEKLNLKDKELEGRLSERAEILSSKGLLDRQEEELARKRGTVIAKRKELEQVEKELATEERVRERQRLNSELAEIMGFKELLHSLDGKMAAYKSDESSQITGIEDRINGIRGNLVSRQALKTERLRDLNHIEEEVARLREQLPVSRNKTEEATILRQTLSGFSQGRPRSITVWNKGHLIASGISLIAGVLMALLISDTLIRIIAGVAGTISALVFFVLARRTEIVFEGQSSADFVRQIKEQWKARTGEELEAETVEGISDIFNRRISTYNSEVMYCENKIREVNRLKALIKEIETEMSSMTQEIIELEDERKRWLNERHVAGRDDYISKIGTYRRIHTEVESKRSLLKGKYGERQAFDDVQREIERKLRVMDEDGVPAKGISDEERQQGKIRLDRLKREIDGLGNEINSASIGNAGLMGGIRSKLEDLNREILDLQQREIPDLNRRISEIELLKKAAGMAFEIFEEIRKDTGLIFDSLALEIGSLMGSVHGDERIVQIKGLKDEDIKMEDAGGDHRYIGNLSTGTQDVFSFAARLALAKKSVDGQWRPLLLDEPFLYMDQHRTKNALKLLKTFQEETRAQGAEWQIILFTKEAELRDLAKETISDAAVHELAVGSTEI